MADIFISYSQKDRAIVAPLAEFLEGRGFDVWWDTALIVGDEFRLEIMRQIAAARQVIVLWSANSVNSDWVLGEAGAARRAEKLLPLRVPELLSTAIPLGFTELHTGIETDRDALLRALTVKGVAPSTGAAADGTAPAAVDGVAGQRWMWWSTRESIAAEVPSVTAIVETVLAVIAYWALAIWLETYAFLLAGVAVAPMVLLRSDQSVALGLRWFQLWEGNWESHPEWSDMTTIQRTAIVGMVVVSAAVSFALSWWLATQYLVGLDGWQVFIGGAIVGWMGFAGALAVVGVGVGVGVGVRVGVLAIAGVGALVAVGAGAGAVAGAGAGAVAIAGFIGVAAKEIFLVVFGLPIGFAIAVMLLLISVGIRTVATLRHLPSGLTSMARNFRRLVLSTSLRQLPELVPNLANTDSRFKFDRWIETSNKNYWTSRVTTCLVLFAFLPAWLYRISIKSTAWFWWPLAYIGREPHEARDPIHMQRMIQGSPFRRLGRWVAVLFLAAFAVVNGWDTLVPAASANGVRLPVLPENSLVAGLLLNRGTGIPWQITGLASAAIALLVGMWTSHAAISLQRANELKDLSALARAVRPFPWIERLARLGFLATVIFWLGLAGHLALSANSQRCWIELSPSVLSWAQTIYGDLAPPAPQCVGKSLP